MHNDCYSRARMRTGCPTPMPLTQTAPAPAAEKHGWGLSGYPLASVYAPLQKFCELYDLDTALMRGTAFSELDLPFVCGDTKGGPCRG